MANRRISPLVLAGICIFLGASFAGLTFLPLKPLEASTSEVTSPQGSWQPIALMAISASDDELAAITARPLFNETRAPVLPKVIRPEPHKKRAADEGALRALTLVGVLISGTSQSILVEDGKGKVEELKLGETFGDWRLTSIEPKGATFYAGDQVFTMVLAVSSEGAITRAPQHASPHSAAQPTPEQEPSRKPRRRMRTY